MRRGHRGAFWFQRLRRKVESNASKSVTFEGASKLTPRPHELSDIYISDASFQRVSVNVARISAPIRSLFHYPFGLLARTNRRLAREKKSCDISTKTIESIGMSARKARRSRRTSKIRLYAERIYNRLLAQLGAHHAKCHACHAYGSTYHSQKLRTHNLHHNLYIHSVRIYHKNT